MFIKNSYRRNAGVLLACVLAMCMHVAAQAGVQEDFAEGNRHNLRGDVVAALPFFRKAAEAGHAGAQAAMGDLMRQSDFTEEAVAYFRKSAEQGNADGQFGLAAMLLVGDGEAQNVAQARQFFTLAAEQGHVLAINELASAYLSGAMGIEESEKKTPQALRWIQLSAENGYRPSMEVLMHSYRTGDYALPVNLAKSQEWAERIRKQSGVTNRTKRGTKKVLILEKQP